MRAVSGVGAGPGFVWRRWLVILAEFTQLAHCVVDSLALLLSSLLKASVVRKAVRVPHPHEVAVSLLNLIPRRVVAKAKNLKVVSTGIHTVEGMAYSTGSVT